MYKGSRVGVVVTAYNEAPFVGTVIETVPDFVDRIYVIDDDSPDDSWSVIQQVASRLNDTAARDLEPAVTDGGDGQRVVPIQHQENRGYGAAVKTGYRNAVDDDMDVIAVMNGDGQMDPDILDRIIDPVVEGDADYAKGNRLLHPDDREDMSAFRFFGNALLTGLSKFASGYWAIGDPQNGYTAISSETVESLDLDGITDEYGFLNHLLAHLNVHERRVADVPMTAIYGDEESSIRYVPFIRFVSLLLLRNFLWRLKTKYVVSEFHPAVVMYGAGSVGVAGGSAGIAGSIVRTLRGNDGFAGAIGSFVALVLGIIALGLGIWFDAEESADLEVTEYEYTESPANTEQYREAP